MKSKPGIMKAHETDGVKASITQNVISEEITDMDYGENIMHDGPYVPKPKSTWVRLNREAYGPGEKGSGQYQSVLRKSSATETENRGSHTDYDVQPGERGKMDTCDKEDEQISAGVAGHPCRK